MKIFNQATPISQNNGIFKKYQHKVIKHLPFQSIHPKCVRKNNFPKKAKKKKT